MLATVAIIPHRRSSAPFTSRTSAAMPRTIPLTMFVPIVFAFVSAVDAAVVTAPHSRVNTPVTDEATVDAADDTPVLIDVQTLRIAVLIAFHAVDAADLIRFQTIASAGAS